jgi:hypothetical protein
VALWTFDVEDAVSFAAFAKNTHVALLFYWRCKDEKIKDMSE